MKILLLLWNVIIEYVYVGFTKIKMKLIEKLKKKWSVLTSVECTDEIARRSSTSTMALYLGAREYENDGYVPQNEKKGAFGVGFRRKKGAMWDP